MTTSHNGDKSPSRVSLGSPVNHLAKAYFQPDRDSVWPAPQSLSFPLPQEIQVIKTVFHLLHSVEVDGVSDTSSPSLTTCVLFINIIVVRIFHKNTQSVTSFLQVWPLSYGKHQRHWNIRIFTFALEWEERRKSSWPQIYYKRGRSNRERFGMKFFSSNKQKNMEWDMNTPI